MRMKKCKRCGKEYLSRQSEFCGLSCAVVFGFENKAN